MKIVQDKRKRYYKAKHFKLLDLDIKFLNKKILIYIIFI
jgi:hypothetical protein